MPLYLVCAAEADDSENLTLLGKKQAVYLGNFATENDVKAIHVASNKRALETVKNCVQRLDITYDLYPRNHPVFPLEHTKTDRHTYLTQNPDGLLPVSSKETEKNFNERMNRAYDSIIVSGFLKSSVPTLVVCQGEVFVRFARLLTMGIVAPSRMWNSAEPAYTEFLDKPMKILKFNAQGTRFSMV